ncbi:MAG: ABC transporter ATP-binding protein [Bacteroidales bacterium]|nr:ABC transporter ATP-binding protein [Candidatus Minthousia equi]
MKNETIRLNNLYTGYHVKGGNKVVAQNINASLYDSELTCLLGVNGSGKSTLLRTLSAFQPALQGEIYLQNKKLNEYSDKEIAKKIGVVLTDRISVQNLLVEELVGLGRSPYTGFWGTLSKEDKEIVEDSIHEVGIDDLKGRMVSTLSDGERQKVLISKVLAQQTPVIFLDEPTAFLDYPSKVDLLRLLRKLAHEMGKTIFLSTHDIELTLQVTDKVWLLDSGEVNIGTPVELCNNGCFSKVFGREGMQFDYSSGILRVAKV